MLDLLVMLGACFGLPTVIALAASGRLLSVKSWLWAAAALAAVVVNLVVVSTVPDLVKLPAWAAGLQWNWTGKIATIAATLAIFMVLPSEMKAQTGILSLPRTEQWGQVVAVVIGLLAFFWGAAYLTRDGSAQPPEYYAFQALMPSLDEEFAYRGVILALLLAAVGRSGRVLGIEASWAALPIISVFGLMHGYGLITSGEPIDFGQFGLVVLIAGVAGAGLYWVREKTGSVWLCVLLHSLMNMGNGVVNGLPA